MTSALVVIWILGAPAVGLLSLNAMFAGGPSAAASGTLGTDGVTRTPR
jgi:hypothetical protein